MADKTVETTALANRPFLTGRKSVAFIAVYVTTGFLIIPFLVAVLAGTQYALPDVSEFPIALGFASLFHGLSVLGVVDLWNRKEDMATRIGEALASLAFLVVLDLLFVAMASALVFPFRYSAEIVNAVTAICNAFLTAWGASPI